MLYNARSHTRRYTAMVSSTVVVIRSLGVVSPWWLIGSKLAKDLVRFHCRLWHWHKMWLMMVMPERHLLIIIVANREGVGIAVIVIAVRHGEYRAA